MCIYVNIYMCIVYPYIYLALRGWQRVFVPPQPSKAGLAPLQSGDHYRLDVDVAQAEPLPRLALPCPLCQPASPSAALPRVIATRPCRSSLSTAVVVLPYQTRQQSSRGVRAWPREPCAP